MENMHYAMPQSIQIQSYFIKKLYICQHFIKGNFHLADNQRIRGVKVWGLSHNSDLSLLI